MGSKNKPSLYFNDDIQKDLMKVSDLTIGPVSTYFVVVNMGSQSPRGLMLEHTALILTLVMGFILMPLGIDLIVL